MGALFLNGEGLVTVSKKRDEDTNCDLVDVKEEEREVSRRDLKYRCPERSRATSDLLPVVELLCYGLMAIHGLVSPQIWPC